MVGITLKSSQKSFKAEIKNKGSTDTSIMNDSHDYRKVKSKDMDDKKA